MSTFVAKPKEVVRQWFEIDAEGVVLGRLASTVAAMLRGKNKPHFATNADTGDFIIIVNAEKVLLTGKKLDKKIYRHHSLYPGGMKEIKCRDLMAKRPERIIELAVRGMLPKNAFGRALYKKLKVFAGPEHSHQAQNPQKFDLSFLDGQKKSSASSNK